MKKKRYIGAYMIIEGMTKYRLPVNSVSVTSSVNSAAVATVMMHPNPHILNLKRGVNMQIICAIKDDSAYREQNYLMFKGDVSSVQVSSNGTSSQYAITLVDDRRYLNELPIHYLRKVLEEDNNQIDDLYADLDFYNISGVYNKETLLYEVKDELALAYMKSTGQKTLKEFVNKMLSLMQPGVGWEDFYINMNEKKRISDNHVIYDTGLYQAALTADIEAASLFDVITDAHASQYVTYEDVLNRLSELGYNYTTCVFPTYRTSNTKWDVKNKSYIMAKGHKKNIWAVELKDDFKKTRSIGVGIGEVTEELVPMTANDVKKAMVAKYGESENWSVMEIENYFVILRGTEDTYEAGNDYVCKTNKNSNQMSEYLIIPKTYGCIPPKVNWLCVSEGITLNLSITEPQVTALKYTLFVDNIATFSHSYPDPVMQDILHNEMTTTGDTAYKDNTWWKPILYFKEATKAKSGEIIIPSDTTGGRYVVTSSAEEHFARPGSKYKEKNIFAVDIAVAANDGTDKGDIPVAAIHDGMATYSYQKAGAGNYVTIISKDQKVKTVYMHLSLVFPADHNGKPVEVRGGDIIGYMGSTGQSSTGVHLHLEYYEKGASGWVSKDPLQVLFRAPGEINGNVFKSMYPSGHLNDPNTSVAAGSFARVDRDKSKYVTSTLDKEAKTITYKKKYAAIESIYGIKRVSVKSDGAREIAKAKGMNPQNKMWLLRQKVRNDYAESRVSGNNARITINGLRKSMVAGLPTLICDPNGQMVYYGMVQDVSHRVDNASGTAYTEVSVSGVLPIRNIDILRKEYSDMGDSALLGLEANGTLKSDADYVKIANEYYENIIGPSSNITEAEYGLMRDTLGRFSLIQTMTSKEYNRRVCTEDQAMMYLYWGDGKKYKYQEDKYEGNFSKTLYTSNDMPSLTTGQRTRPFVYCNHKDTINGILTGYLKEYTYDYEE